MTSFTKTHRRPGSKVPNFDDVKLEKLAVFASPRTANAIFNEYERAGVTHVICMCEFRWRADGGGAPDIGIDVEGSFSQFCAERMISQAKFHIDQKPSRDIENRDGNW